MATQTLISVEEYLRTAYEPDAEYVDGHIAERGMSETPHSAVQVRLVQLFTPLSRDHNLHLMTELRMRISAARIRIPDFAVFQEKPAELVPSHPPLIAVEIVSREDRHTDIVQKFEDYRSWDVPHFGLTGGQYQYFLRRVLPSLPLRYPPRRLLRRRRRLRGR